MKQKRKEEEKACGVEWSGVRSGQTREKEGLIRWVGSFVLVDSDTIVKGFLSSELWTFLSRLCVGLVLPSSLRRVYLSYLSPRLGILSSPPYITTNSHHSSTHLLNTNLLLFSRSETHRNTHTGDYKVSQKKQTTTTATTTWSIHLHVLAFCSLSVSPLRMSLANLTTLPIC